MNLLLKLGEVVHRRAIRIAYKRGRERLDEFDHLQPGLLRVAKKEYKIIGFYINKSGRVDTNYHLFDNACEAGEWAARCPSAGAKHALIMGVDLRLSDL